MPIDPALLKQLIESFSTELNEHTQLITDGLLALEKNNLSEAERIKISETNFRAAHNIKGTARSLGINHIGEIAHRLESLFAAIQKNQRVYTAETTSQCFEAIDKMQIALQSFIENKPLPFDIDLFLTTFEDQKSPTNTTITETKAPIKDTSDHIITPKAQPTPEYESVRVPITKIEKITSYLEDIQVNKIAIEDFYTTFIQFVNNINEFSQLWNKVSPVIKQNPNYQAGNDQLNEMMQSAKLMQKSLRPCVNQLSQLSYSLQDEVRTMRMVAINNLLCTFPRYVRDLATICHKNIELTMHGEEIKIDKAVLDGLKDPLVHLLRNAVDHGIEDKQVRLSLGKAEMANINIDIKESDSQMHISVSDDGAGIDLKKITALALEKKLISDKELSALAVSDILNLIFSPGFSTKEVITDLSGRGVGLDVVKSNVEALKGSISVHTEVNKGTTFTLSVPLTVSSERGLLVGCASQLFVIPTTSVERTLMVRTDQIVNIQGSQAIIVDEQTIPLRLLADALQINNTTLIPEENIPIVIIKQDKNAMAFIINEIIGEREIVLKNLSPPLSKVPGVIGGTLLEGNQVVVVLEPNYLLNQGIHHHIHATAIEQKPVASKSERIRVLVVDDSITTRTLEKSILEAHNYDVTVAVNGKEAWNILQKQPFSLLITDVMMPIMDGFTLTDHVKKSKELANLPVIIVTSMGSDTEKKRGIEVGADAYIVKNEFESGALLDVISQLI